MSTTHFFLATVAAFAVATGVVIAASGSGDQAPVLAHSSVAPAVHTHECSAHAFSGSPLDLLLGRKTSSSLGHAVYDRKMREEVSNQRQFFQGVKAEVLILDEQHYELRNAYASPGGKIYMGKNMFFYTIRNYNELAVAGILAHEWSHRVQYTFHWDKQLKNPALELEADAMAGFYMAIEKGYAWSQIDDYFRSTEKTGDYDVASPQHHGTPNQRVAAAYLGVQLANEAVANGKGFSYEELHARIIDSLNANVIRQENGEISRKEGSAINAIALGETSNKQITAPVLPASERKKYHPYEQE